MQSFHDDDFYLFFFDIDFDTSDYSYPRTGSRMARTQGFVTLVPRRNSDPSHLEYASGVVGLTAVNGLRLPRMKVIRG